MHTLLSWDDQLIIEEYPRVLAARFLTPHRVICSDGQHGGIRTDLQAVYDHQSCEASGHDGKAMETLAQRSEDFHRQRCDELGVDADKTISLGTAANMRCHGMARRDFRHLSFVALATAGVQGNAGRAGDRASVMEYPDHYDQLTATPSPHHGTIVTMVFSATQLSPGALVRACVIATEAKAGLLEELKIPSRYSSYKATGTGTDQIMIAAPIGKGLMTTSPGKHTMAGQMIGEAVTEAISEALILQNGYERSARRQATQQLARFGFSCEYARTAAREFLSEENYQLFLANFSALDCDPHIVAGAAALAEIADQIRARILPRSCSGEYASWLGAMLAVAASAGQLSADEAYREIAHSYRIIDADNLKRIFLQADFSVIADGDIADHFRSGTDKDAVSDRWVTFHLPPCSSSECDLVVDQNVVTDDRCLSNDHTHAVVDEQTFTDTRAWMYFDSGEETRRLADQPGEESTRLTLPEPMGDTVSPDRVNS